MLEYRLSTSESGDDATFYCEPIGGILVGYIDQWDDDKSDWIKTPAAATVDMSLNAGGVTLRIVPLTVTLNGVAIVQPQLAAAGVDEDEDD